MNKELLQAKFEQETNAVITSVKIDGGVKDCYLVYSDTDSQVDYFHACSFGTNLTIEYLQKEGADVISVYTCGGEQEGSPEAIKTLKKIQKIADKAGYINNVKGEYKYQIWEGVKNEWYEISGTFVRKVGV